MKTVIDLFNEIKVDLSDIGLIREPSFAHYFCTPLNAVIFAGTGMDGVHFCVVPEEKDQKLEHSPVYVVSPMMPEHYVEAVAENFYDFISIVVSAKDASLLESISYSAKDRFNKDMQRIPTDSLEIKAAITALNNAFSVKIADDVYDFVRQVQAKVHINNPQFSDEYYEITGQRK